MHRVVAPARVAAVETGAGSSPGSLRRAAASGRESGCGAPSCTAIEARRREHGANRPRRARASRARRHPAHSTQSCVRLRDGEILLRPEAEPRLLDDARAPAASNFYGIIDAAGIDDDRLRGKAARNARHSASCVPASRVITTRDRSSGASGSDIASSSILPCALCKARGGKARGWRLEGASHSTCNRSRNPPSRHPAPPARIDQPRTTHERHGMTSALIIRPSSLGDIVHALPIVHDLARHCPGIAIDWVAEEPFAGLVALNHGVRRVIPVALRRWRHHVHRARDMARVRRLSTPARRASATPR